MARPPATGSVAGAVPVAACEEPQIGDCKIGAGLHFSVDDTVRARASSRHRFQVNWIDLLSPAARPGPSPSPRGVPVAPGAGVPGPVRMPLAVRPCTVTP